MDLYDRINLILKHKKQTKSQLSEETHISYNTLMSLFHRRSKNMNHETISKIAEYLDVSVDYLLNGESHTPMILEEPNENLSFHDSGEKELLRIYQSLSQKHKTMLLSKAYELEDHEKHSK